MSENKRTIIVKNLFALLMVFMLVTIVSVRLLTKPPENAAAGEGQIITHRQSADNTSNFKPPVALNLSRSSDIEDEWLKEGFTGINDENWREFDAEENENVAMKIESLLMLHLIVEGINPQAFINDSLYKVGDKIDISDGNRKYDCVIENISQTDVLIDCDGLRIKLELANQPEVIEQ